MRRSPRVRTKLVLLSVLVVLVVTFGLTAYDFLAFRQWIEEDLQERAIVFAREIAVALGDRPELASSRRLDAVVRRILQVRPSVQQLDILVFDGEDTRLAASSARDARLPFHRTDRDQVRLGRVISRLVEDSGGPRYWEVLVPIARDYGVVGAVAAKFSAERVERVTSEVALRNFSVAAASVVLMGVLMGVVVRLVVDRPVGHFMRAIARIRDGDASATVDLQSRDEFGALAQAFNALMARINQFSTELQVKIREATGELDRRYEEVQRLNALLFELQRSLTRAERLALAGRLMGEVAHEVGTPLHSVAGHLELLRKDLPGGPAGDDLRRRVGIIETQVARVIEIIARLLDLTRRSAGAARPVALNPLVQETAELVRPSLAAADLTLVVAAAPALPSVQGHADQLQQVVLNLLTNAMDATPAGGRIDLTTRALGETDEVEIAVADTGPGISAGERAQIFEPFFSTKGARGTGLGLFITAQIVRDHQGRIEVESEEGKGATFRVFLPALGAASA
jgi:signal transduction histidine kinase